MQSILINNWKIDQYTHTFLITNLYLHPKAAKTAKIIELLEQPLFDLATRFPDISWIVLGDFNLNLANFGLRNKEARTRDHNMGIPQQESKYTNLKNLIIHS